MKDLSVMIGRCSRDMWQLNRYAAYVGCPNFRYTDKKHNYNISDLKSNDTPGGLEKEKRKEKTSNPQLF